MFFFSKSYRFLSFLSVLIFSSFAQASDYSICFVHIGNKIPPYLETAVTQARLFNKDCSIYVLLNKELRDHYTQTFAGLTITLVELESLPLSPEHELFAQRVFRDSWRDSFWVVVRERFLYLNDFMLQYDLKNIFHLEYDNMLYVDLQEILPLFIQHPSPIAATFDHDYRAIAGFIYIRDRLSMQKVAKFFADKAAESRSDMDLLALFKYDAQGCIGHLPIIMEDYTVDHPLISPNGDVGKNPVDYFGGSDSIQSIFDAAALGQYLGGLDPIHGDVGPGVINGTCIFNPSLLEYIWEKDASQRRIPYAVYKNKKFRINNLHIHSKRLHNFVS